MPTYFNTLQDAKLEVLLLSHLPAGPGQFQFERPSTLRSFLPEHEPRAERETELVVELPAEDREAVVALADEGDVVVQRDADADARLNHRAQIIRGVLAERCATVLTDFFAAKRRLGKG